MARRRKTSPAEDLAELISRLPWWAGVGLALLSYLVCSAIATRPLTVSAQPDVTGMIWRAFATAGRIALPMICLVAAAVSAIRRRRRRQLVTNVAKSDAADALNDMRWQEFEVLIGEAFRLQGFQVAETGGGGADGGIDLVLSKPAQNGRETYLVQCKQWRAYKVGVDVVRQLYGVMAARGAAGGFVVTSGRYTDEAVRFAEGRNVRLIDGPELHRMIREARGAAGSAAAARHAPVVRPVAAPSAAVKTPSCPSCGKPMVLRTAKRGANVGANFWGCSDYPTCRGTRRVG